MKITEILRELKKHRNKQNVEGMARFGIRGKNVLGGPSIPELRRIAKRIGKDHVMAEKLWKSEIHEARILAGLIDDPKKVTSSQMDRWAESFDSWDICDQVCSNLFDKTPLAFGKAKKWTKSKKEYVKRAGFAMMAVLAVHRKEEPDEIFLEFSPLIKKESTDERNFVKKAVNWAIRQIGKKNDYLRNQALGLSYELLKINDKTASWIARDAIRELKQIKKRKINDGK